MHFYRMFSVLLILSWLSALVATGPAELHSVKPTGIIFEDIGRAITYRHHWTILTQIKIPPWNDTLDFVQSCERTLEHLCNCITFGPGESNCKHWARDIKLRTVRIKEKIDEINIYTQCKKSRRKRGLINLGGSIAKFLFGTMDHEDSEHIFSKLEELDTNNQRSINLAKKQLTLIKANTEVMGHSLLNLTSQYNLLVEKTNRFNNFIAETLNNVTGEVKRVQVMAEMNEITLFMLNELQKIFEQLTTTFFVLESIQRQELSPLMIPGKEFSLLYEKITLSQEDLKPDFAIAKVVTKTYSKCLDDRILIKILIPILESPYFSVNKIYLFPVPLSGDTFSIFDNIPDYLFNSTFPQKNFELSETKFQSSCTSLNTTFFICKLLGPIRITPGERNCVQSMFENPFQESSSCVHRILNHFDNFLVPLRHENAWLYWMHNITPLYCQCLEGLFTLHLHGSGIFRLLKPCKFRLTEFTIPYHPNALHNLSFLQPGQIETPTLDKYKPVLEANISNNNLKKLSVLESASLHSILQANSKSTKYLESEIAQFEAEKSTNTLHVKFNILTALVGTIITASFFACIIKCIIKNKREATNNVEEERPEVRFISNPIIIPRREQLIVSTPREEHAVSVQVECQPTTSE